MSGYMPAQALLKTLLLTNASFGASDVTEGDDRILDRGITNGAVLYPGGVTEYDTAGMTRAHQWEGYIDLFTKFIDNTAYATFGTLRDSVIATIAGAPCLSSVYFVTMIRGEDGPSEVYERVNGQLMGPYFLTQRLRVTIEEQV